jgi:hypothetical protein
MRRKLFFCLLVTLSLPFAAKAQDQNRCKVEKWQFANNQTAPISMSMSNDGKPCGIRKFTFQGGSEATYSVSTPASNGEVVITENGASYTPKAGFSGTDKFVIRVTGTSAYSQHSARNGQLEVTVTVAAP